MEVVLHWCVGKVDGGGVGVGVVDVCEWRGLFGLAFLYKLITFLVYFYKISTNRCLV
ncbi:hypothetical protein Hanom_Chr09g00831481 [Helianthus anomalus]